MGENLVLNMESKGFLVSVFNRTVEKVDKFINGRGAHTYERTDKPRGEFFHTNWTGGLSGLD